METRDHFVVSRIQKIEQFELGVQSKYTRVSVTPTNIACDAFDKLETTILSSTMELRWGSRMTHETKYELASFETRLSLPDELATLNSIVVCGDERAQLRRQEISSDRIRVITPSKLDTEKVCNPKRKHQIAYRFHWRRNDSVQMEFR